MLNLAYIGGLGLMAGPAGVHLKAGGPARVLRVHDRGSPGAQRDAFRASWKEHGAELVGDFQALIGDGDLDGVVVCCGKNGDDLAIIGELTKLMHQRCKTGCFILHLSTVSAAFTRAALESCSEKGVGYVNYPLTGGPLGAQLGGGHPNGMLILASGERDLYRRLEPTLEVLGRPRYFGESVSAGAETKLIGQHLVFNGCTGICTGAALYSECFADGTIGGPDQAAYFEFLNGGAGGTRQWEVALSKGVKDDEWSAGFAVRHAVVDAIYAAQLARENGLPRFSIQPMINIALAFSFLLQRHPDTPLATHAIARELLSSRSDALDAFMAQRGAYDADVDTCIRNCIASLPDDVRCTVLLDISARDFSA